MDLKTIMQKKRFVVVGDTQNEEKYAYKIKQALLEHGYQVQCVGKELASLNDTEGPLEIVDLCIHPAKGIRLLQECEKPVEAVLIQPGAESAEILDFLQKKEIPFLEGCALVGLRLYAGEN